MPDLVVIATGFLEPLREYPRWLVLLCVTVVAGGTAVLIGRSLKLALYAGLAVLLLVFLGGFAWWLER